MQYEKVILEMLSRIQLLEEEVARLKKQQAGATFGSVAEQAPRAHRTNKKVTKEMQEACYAAGRKIAKEDFLDARLLAKKVNEETGMNPNNALMTIFAVVALINGELYKRGISSKACAYFFDCILRDDGKGSLQRAIAAMRMHIDYRRTLHHNVDLLEQTCDQYQEIIDGN